MNSETLLEYVLANYRWVFVVFFVLPFTVVGKIWAISQQFLWSYDSRSDHEKNVKNIQHKASKCKASWPVGGHF